VFDSSETMITGLNLGAFIFGSICDVLCRKRCSGTVSETKSVHTLPNGQKMKIN